MACKPGQNKTEYRGELEVKLGFTVRASESVGGSVADLSKKNKGSISSLNKVAGNIGGSLLSLGGKEKKNFKKIAASVTRKVEKVGGKAKKSVSSLKLNMDRAGLASLPESSQWGDEIFDSQRDGLHNEDPGVNSDDEDDMFQFDTLSHRSSHSSLATSKLGTVSAVSTPCQGSMESLGIHTTKRGSQPAICEVLGEWEDKLMGNKKGLHVTPAHDDTISMTSITSGVSRHLSSAASQATTKDTWTPYKQKAKETMGSMSSLPSYNEAMNQDLKINNSVKKEKTKEKTTKKKIIPVVSDSSESSPSPDEPSTPVDSPQPSSISSRFRMSQRSILSLHDEDNMQSLGQKLKNSYSFREKHEGKFSHRSSIESVSSQGPPHGTRVVLGRETSPVPSPALSTSRIPSEIMDKFSRQTREDLIEMVITLQASVEEQGKKVADLEDYVDTMMIKVMEASPVLLEKNVISYKPSNPLSPKSSQAPANPTPECRVL